MNLDNNCIKDILLEIEKLPLGQELPFNKLCDTLSKYTEKELTYTCITLIDENLIKGKYKRYNENDYLILIQKLTMYGHEYLENLK